MQSLSPQDSSDPTATHVLAEPHETSLSPKLGSLNGWIDHRLPFHRSTNGAPSLSEPTAVQALVEVQDTALRAAVG
jgi:hypothetical protein